MKKRKLPIVKAEDDKTLMPEVLPQPTRNAAGSPRQRTVRHMRKILAAAAVAGIAATTTSRTRAAGDAGDDAATDGSVDAIPEDAATDAVDESDALDSGYLGYDVRPGYDPAPPPPDANMNVGYDPAGPYPGSGTSNSSGCGCSVVGRKGK